MLSGRIYVPNVRQTYWRVQKSSGKRNARRRLRYQSHLGTLLWNGTKLGDASYFNPYIPGLPLSCIKAARFLGCNSLLHTRSFDKKPVSRTRKRGFGNKKRHRIVSSYMSAILGSSIETRITVEKTRLSRLMESSIAKKFSYETIEIRQWNLENVLQYIIVESVMYLFWTYLNNSGYF